MINPMTFETNGDDQYLTHARDIASVTDAVMSSRVEYVEDENESATAGYSQVYISTYNVSIASGYLVFNLLRGYVAGRYFEIANHNTLIKVDEKKKYVKFYISAKSKKGTEPTILLEKNENYGRQDGQHINDMSREEDDYTYSVSVPFVVSWDDDGSAFINDANTLRKTHVQNSKEGYNTVSSDSSSKIVIATAINTDAFWDYFIDASLSDLDALEGRYTTYKGEKQTALFKSPFNGVIANVHANISTINDKSGNHVSFNDFLNSKANRQTKALVATSDIRGRTLPQNYSTASFGAGDNLFNDLDLSIAGTQVFGALDPSDPRRSNSNNNPTILEINARDKGGVLTTEQKNMVNNPSNKVGGYGGFSTSIGWKYVDKSTTLNGTLSTELVRNSNIKGNSKTQTKDVGSVSNVPKTESMRWNDFNFSINSISYFKGLNNISAGLHKPFVGGSFTNSSEITNDDTIVRVSGTCSCSSIKYSNNVTKYQTITANAYIPIKKIPIYLKGSSLPINYTVFDRPSEADLINNLKKVNQTPQQFFNDFFKIDFINLLLLANRLNVFPDIVNRYVIDVNNAIDAFIDGIPRDRLNRWGEYVNVSKYQTQRPPTT